MKYNTFINTESAIRSGKTNLRNLRLMLVNSIPTGNETSYDELNGLPEGNGYKVRDVPTTIVLNRLPFNFFEVIVKTNELVFEATGTIGPIASAVLYCATSYIPLGWWNLPEVTTLCYTNVPYSKGGDTLTVFTNDQQLLSFYIAPYDQCARLYL